MKRAALLFLLAGTLFGAASVRPQQLRCEYRVNPQGIDVTDPRLSWILICGHTPWSHTPGGKGLRRVPRAGRTVAEH